MITTARSVRREFSGPIEGAARMHLNASARATTSHSRHARGRCQIVTRTPPIATTQAHAQAQETIQDVYQDPGRHRIGLDGSDRFPIAGLVGPERVRFPDADPRTVRHGLRETAGRRARLGRRCLAAGHASLSHGMDLRQSVHAHGKRCGAGVGGSGIAVAWRRQRGTRTGPQESGGEQGEVATPRPVLIDEAGPISAQREGCSRKLAQGALKPSGCIADDAPCSSCTFLLLLQDLP